MLTTTSSNDAVATYCSRMEHRSPVLTGASARPGDINTLNDDAAVTLSIFPMIKRVPRTGLDPGKVVVEHAINRGVHYKSPTVDKQSAVAERGDRCQIVAHVEDRPSTPRDFSHPPDTSLLERWSPTLSTSSMKRISGSRYAATAKASLTCIPLE